MKVHKIMIVTTGRADYGLLCPLFEKLGNNENFIPQLVATGTHLSPAHGQTINYIYNDGFAVFKTVEMTNPGDSEDDICSSISTGLAGFSKLFEDHRPSLLFVLGDRYELWSVCMAAVIHKIPIAHIHGGEVTFGLIDDPIRHSVTKMSAFHFASMDQYARRIIQMGEAPEKVFVVGALGLDNIRNVKLMDCDELTEMTGVDFHDDVALLTYHPVTLDNLDKAREQIETVLQALNETSLKVLMTMPNADPASSSIFKALMFYSEKFPEKYKLINNLGQKGYLSALKYACIMVGNSSSGIIESSSFGLPVVNIGDRQAGRNKPKNVLDCDCVREEILCAIDKAMSKEFQTSIFQMVNPYGDGKTAERIVEIVEKIDLSKSEQFLKKGFVDISCN